MSKFEIDFKVIKNDKEEIQGFSLIAQPQTEAEVFCGTFPKALIDKDADIKFEGNEIVFEHPTCVFQGRCAFELNDVDNTALQLFLGGRKQLKFERAGFFTPGFKIVAV